MYIGVAEKAFNRCVETNEGNDCRRYKVHPTSDNYEVDFNYEFLEDFQDKHSPDRYIGYTLPRIAPGMQENCTVN